MKNVHYCPSLLILPWLISVTHTWNAQFDYMYHKTPTPYLSNVTGNGSERDGGDRKEGGTGTHDVLLVVTMNLCKSTKLNKS